jgi:hypothetical protein
MTTQPPLRRNPWRFSWRLVTGNGPLLGALLGLALFLAILALVPQIPRSTLTADRWLAQTRFQFGAATEILYQQGLFSLADSPLPRLLLAVTAFLLLVRTAERVDRVSRERRKSANRHLLAGLSSVLAHAGPLIVIIGMLAGQLWGWRADGLIGQVGDTLNVAGHGEITLEGDVSSVRSTQRGTIVHATGSGPQLAIRAHDAGGQPLGVQQSPREAIRSELTVALVPEAPEAYFAVPDAELVARVSLVPEAGLSADAPLLLQVFQIPTGALMQEAELTEARLELSVDGTQLEILRSSYLVLSIARNPGRWLEGAGLAAGVAGVLGTLVRSRRSGKRLRRVWLVLWPLAVALTVVVAGMALRSLAAAGSLWDRSPTQAGLTALWLAGVSAWLACERDGADDAAPAGGES